METWNGEEMYAAIWEQPASKVASKYGISVDALKVVPVAGNLLSAGLAVRDGVHGVGDYNTCLGGH